MDFSFDPKHEVLAFYNPGDSNSIIDFNQTFKTGSWVTYNLLKHHEKSGELWFEITQLESGSTTSVVLTSARPSHLPTARPGHAAQRGAPCSPTRCAREGGELF